jgi:hypothetical protein
LEWLVTARVVLARVAVARVGSGVLAGVERARACRRAAGVVTPEASLL